ncbi:MAG: phosphoglycerate dehydrogenase [Chloroflexota bacterium]|nr:MAG: phosphoglycerate dehydrogenase [Chloroflexota bacterium]
MRIIVCDPIASDGVELLRTQADVDVRVGLTAEVLESVIGEYDAAVVRSETKITARILAAGSRLKVVGRAGVGIDNIDVEAATQHGIVVVNAPTGNNIAAAEHAIALMFSLARRIPQAHASLKAGKWERSKFMGTELRSKTLGVIGLGKIGTAVARRALGLEMKVLGFDPFISPEHARSINVQLVSLDELLRNCDFITIHTPLTSSTRNLIGARQFTMMKPTACIVNTSRGDIIEEHALYAAVEEGQIAGAAIDVFVEEPATNSILLKSNKIVVTPHLGGSTKEAQVSVAVDVADQILAVLDGKPARYAVNLPMIPPESLSFLTPYMLLGEKLGELATQLTDGQLDTTTIICSGDIAQHDTTPLTAAVIKGLLRPVSEEQVNLVNARLIARNRGLNIIEQKGSVGEVSHGSLIAVNVSTSAGLTSVAGTMVRGEPHIVQVDGYWVDLVPSGYTLLSHHRDRPGIIGAVGVLLGSHDINISSMQVGRMQKRGPALMVLGLDEHIDEEVLAQIRAIPDIHTAKVVSL